MKKDYVLILSLLLITIVSACNTENSGRGVCGGKDNPNYEEYFEENAIHPTPCITAVLGTKSSSIAQSVTGRNEFIYREVELDNREQVVVVNIGKKIEHARSNGNKIFKETADYIIFENEQLTNGEPNISIVANGKYNDEYNFIITFHDRNNDYSDEEIVNKIENIINKDLKIIN